MTSLTTPAASSGTSSGSTRRPRAALGARGLAPFGALILIEAVVLIFSHGSSYYTSICLEWAAFALLAQGFNVIAGYAGRLAFGNVIFYGISAYLVVGGAVHGWFPELAGLGVAIAACCAIGFVLSLALWRVDGLLFALATFALAAMLEQLFNVFGTFGGSGGLQEPLAVSTSLLHLGFTSQFTYLVIGGVLILLAAGVTLSFSRSTVGREAQATREDRTAAATSGIDGRRVTALAWMLSAGITAVAGAFFAQYNLFVEPTSAFGLSTITLIVVPAILGGMGSVWGPVVGSVIVPIGLLLDRLSGSKGVTSLNLLVYGAVLIVVVRAYPGGLSAAFAALRRRVGERRHPTPDESSPAPHAVTAGGSRGSGPGAGISGPPSAAATKVRNPAGPSLLEVRDARRSFGGVHALQGVGFAIGEGEVVGLLGPNGAGKSTLFNCITGVERLDSGSVLLAGSDLAHRRPHERARVGIARTYQNVRLFANLTARENVAVGTLRRSGHRAAESRADEMLSMVGLVHGHDRPAGALSLVDQRRVELARAMVTDARLVLLDEVMTGLNEEEAEAMRAVVRRLHADHGTSFVIVEHVMGHILPLIERVIVMDKGRLLADGEPREILRREDVMVAYFGRSGPAGPIDG